MPVFSLFRLPIPREKKGSVAFAAPPFFVVGITPPLPAGGDAGPRKIAAQRSGKRSVGR